MFHGRDIILRFCLSETSKNPSVPNKVSNLYFPSTISDVLRVKLGHDNSGFAWQLSVLLCCFIGIDHFKLGHYSMFR